MFRINCHAHTQCSDGAESMLNMARAAKEFGLSALVVTDHDSITHTTWPSCVREREILEQNDLLPLPVIIGSEIRTPFGEYLLFGHSALKMWEHYKYRLDRLKEEFDHSLWIEVFKRRVLSKTSFDSWCGVLQAKEKGIYNYALVMCHPRRTETCYLRATPPEWWELVHGFEIQNGKHEKYDESSPEVVSLLRELIPGAAELRNSDAHHAEGLSDVWNETKTEIKTEDELISWLRRGRRERRLQERLKKHGSYTILP